MIAMNIEGVRRNFWRSDLYIVSLVDAMGQRLLNIVIGQQEAYVIAMALHRLDSPRPMTLHFMANAFRALNVVLEEVRIEQLQRSPLPFFYAVAQLRNGETVQELDVRPSDALGLAVLLSSPISVSEQLLEDAGIVLPEGKTPELHYVEQLLKHAGIALPEGKKLRLGYSTVPARDAVIKEIKATLSGIPQPRGEKEFEQARKNYLRFVLREDFDQ